MKNNMIPAYCRTLLVFLSFCITPSLFAVSMYHEHKTPKLVVQVIVSQMRYDYMAKFGKNFSNYGFRKLLSEGMNCTNARYNYMFTQSAPGIVTLMSGTQPAQHGIVGDGWINYTTNESISATSDVKEKGVGCDEGEGQYSPRRLLVSTIADELKRHYPESKIVSIAADPNGAILAGGISPENDVYWFDERYGGWVTSTYYKQVLPQWVTTFNDSTLKVEYTNKLWHISLPIDSYVCHDASSILLDTTVKFSFNTIFRPKNKEYDRMQQTPFGNSYLKDFALEMIRRDSLGQDDIPDLLTLNFSSHRYITKYFGIESVELEDAFYKLDQDLGDLISYLDGNIGKENYILMLTSDHGTSDNISKDKELASSGTFNAMQFKVLISGFLGAQYGDGDWVSEYRNRQIYLNRRLIFEKGLSLEEIQNKVATFALQFGGIAQAIPSLTLQSNYYGKGILHKIQNSFYPKHSGDVVINLLPGWIELEDEDAEWITSASGSPYEYDIHVPLLWYGSDIAQSALHRTIDMIDVAPTICEILGIAHTNACEGLTINELITQLE